MDKRLQDFDNFIPNPDQDDKKPVARQSDQLCKQEDASALRFFFEYLDKKLNDAKIKDDHAQSDYLEQYVDYANQHKDKINVFAQREARKLKIM